MESESRCESCERFDKSDRLEKAAEKLLNEFLEKDKTSSYISVRSPDSCSTYWQNYLSGLIARRGLSIKLRVVNGEGECNAYNIADYCSRG